MKKKVLYTCEHCGTDYEDMDEASGCEKSHLLDLEITDRLYLARGNWGEHFNFPTRIVLRSAEHPSESALYVIAKDYYDYDDYDI